jgi:hypothetical protein
MESRTEKIAWYDNVPCLQRFALSNDSTKIGDVNNDNFLHILELLGHYDEATRGYLAKSKWVSTKMTQWK